MALAPWIAPAVLAEYVHNAGDPTSPAVPRPHPPSGRRRVDRSRLHRGLLERPDVHGQPGPLRHVLDARPVVHGAVARPARARSTRSRLPGLRARRLDEAAPPHHDDDPLLRSPGRRLRVRRRLAAAVRRGAARRRCDRPGRAPPPVARGRDRPLLRDGRRPDDGPRPLGSQVQRPSRHRGQPLERLRQHDGRPAGQDDRARPAGSPRRSSATSRATTAACSSSTSGSTTTSATRSATTPSRVRPTSGRSTPVSSATRTSSHRPSRTSTTTASATRTRCATRRAGGPSARSG